MRLMPGWNHIPEGYGADFDTDAAPWWLRVWLNIPFVDRFAYPVLIRRGHAYLTPHPGWVGPLGPVTGGWRLRKADHIAPGSVSYLRSEEG